MSTLGQEQEERPVHPMLCTLVDNEYLPGCGFQSNFFYGHGNIDARLISARHAWGAANGR